MFSIHKHTAKFTMIFALFLVLALSLVACQPENGLTPGPDNGALPGTGQEQSVEITAAGYQPRELTVTAGSTVVWTQNDDLPHTVTADDGSFNSGTLDMGDTFSQTFNEPGEYPYYCEFHGGPAGSGMSGVIIVTGN
jgi:plastocyanin